VNGSDDYDLFVGFLTANQHNKAISVNSHADVADRLQFLSKQISLLLMKQKRYSCVIISNFVFSLCHCLYIIVCVTQY
jgi:hypothetical protein